LIVLNLSISAVKYNIYNWYYYLKISKQK